MHFKTLIAFTFTCLFGYLAIRQVEWDPFVAAFQQVDMLLLLAAVFVQLLCLSTRAFRWQAVLSSLVLVPLRRMFPYVVIGMLANDLIPARVGELYRAWLVTRREGLNYASSLASVVVERVIDGLFVVGMFVTSLWLIGIEDGGLRELRITAGLLFGGLGVGLGLLVLLPAFMRWVILSLTAWLPQAAAAWIRKTLDHFLIGIGVLRHPSTLLRVLFWAAMLWLSELLLYGVILSAMGLDLSIAEIALVLSLVSLVLVLPSAPGYIGVYHLACVTALGLCGIDSSQALAAAVVLNAFELIVTDGLGMVLFLRMGIELPGRKWKPDPNGAGEGDSS